MKHFALAAGLLLLLGAAGALGLALPEGRAPADDSAVIASGHALYDRHCASCHGRQLEGQPNWWRPGPDGRLPAPPHDETGHTWQHSDAELFELIAHSVYRWAAPGYRSDMPAFEGTLGDSEIRAVIAYVKSTWPPGVRAYQAAQNPGGPALADLPGDWHFPPSCGYHFESRNR